MIEIHGVTKRYDQNLVLDDVSTEIPKGQITAFIGPNGAGKSTLLGVITRMHKAERGTIVIDGRALADYGADELARKISVLRQNNSLQLRLTVRELVAFGRYPYSKGRLNADDKAIVEEAIRYMGLETMAGRFLDELSGGEQQRAYIAMVVAQDTDYIFLDEPLNNLDMKHSVEIMGMLKKLCREKDKTVVIVIHDINFASVYADRVLAIHGNNIHINDRVEQVIRPEVLHDIYDMDFRVCDIEGDRICVYYRKHHHHKHRQGHHHKGEHPGAPHQKPVAMGEKGGEK